jgi:hypothetical protein
MKTKADVPRITRTAWWLTFIFLITGSYLARWVYESGLSFWLKRADFTYTASAVLIAIVAFSVFAVGCIGRLKDINASVTGVRVLLLFPIWLFLMATVPSASPEMPDPLVRTRILAKRISVAAGAFVLIATSLFLFVSKTPQSPSSSEGSALSDATSASTNVTESELPLSQQLSFEGCLELIRRTSQELGVAPLNIVETTEMRVVKYVTIDGSVLVTCDRAQGTAVVTRH